MSEYNEKYRQLVETILTEGTKQKCRNGTQLIIPNYSFTVQNMATDHKLLLRKMYYGGILGEFRTLIDKDKPLTNVSQFEANGCNYWKLWAKPNGDLNIDYYNMLHPQLEDIIDQIKTDPDSRRHVIGLWNHDHVKSGELSLPNCWHTLTFSVIDGIIHLNWVQRSVDTAIGLPSDVYLAYLFMDHIAQQTGLNIGSCMFSLSNVHIYTEHVENAFELLERTEDDYKEPLKFDLKG